MAEGHFDGRYRYDYIYPRGRSGETLRAFDEQADDRPVVIKRPAPNDAPPIRAGQEVSILNERRALKALSGHPVLTELLGDGHFIVGGVSHQYIVMERGVGTIVEEMVIERARHGERLPTLEMLVILDYLLDLLEAAHSKDIIYNDVDSKHLFWNRDTYRLKVIDWGNAVFLEGDDATPQGISRQTDVFQVGELIYFILTGGGRAEVPRDAEPDFQVDFGESTEFVPPGLQRIVSRALNPNLKARYASIADLRRDLAAARKPFEQERSTILARVNERLRRDRSKNELYELADVLRPAIEADPGYPATRESRQEIEDRLNDLQIAADLDAVRIYLESGNWGRSADLLHELRGGARGDTLRLVRLLLDWATLLVEADSPPTDLITEAVANLFDGKAETAAHTLMVAGTPDDATHRLHMYLAERVTSHIPDVTLLRPNLFRLGEALATLDGTEGVRLTEQRELLNEIQEMLQALPDDVTVSLISLRDTYRGVVDRLSAIKTLMEAVNLGLSDRRLPLSSLERALNAAMALADNMHVIGKQATSGPRDALAALDNSRAIDPTSPAWDAVANLLNELYRRLQTYQTYVPVADGSDLASWLQQSRADLVPFSERLFDELLLGMIAGLKVAADAWETYADATVTGNRIDAVAALTEASRAVSTISPTLSGWLNQLRSVISGADYIERHALAGGLGRALADGWQAFDRGQLSDAERLAKQADAIATTDAERSTVQRFRALAETARDWVERNGVSSNSRSEKALETIQNLFTESEQNARQSFDSQMPSMDTYLRAMGKGIVETYKRHSTAAVRLLMFDYVLRGTLDTHEGNLEDADFWLAAASRTLESDPLHIAPQTLENFIQKRRDLNDAEAVLNQMTGLFALQTLDTIREEIEGGPQAKTLTEAVHSMRELESALPDWANAEFRTAGLKLENATKAVREAERIGQISLEPYRNWLARLQTSAAELYTVRRNLQDLIESKPDGPIPALHDLHRRMLDETENAIGSGYTSTLQLWYDTYCSFAEVMEDESLRRSGRLNRLSDLFRAMFIDRHPAYTLYRHWNDLTERAPEFPPPPTDEPEPRLNEEEEDIFEPEAELLPETPASTADATPQRPTLLVAVGILGIVGLVIGGLFWAGVFDARPGVIPVTISPTPTIDQTGTQVAIVQTSPTEQPETETPEPATATIEPSMTAAATNTPTEPFLPVRPVVIDGTILPSETATPTITNTPEPSATPTITPTASDTSEPTPTFTPTITPTASDTPTPTVPSGGFQGETDLLALLERLPREDAEAIFWEAERFSQEPESEAWRFGVGFETVEDNLLLAPSAALLDQYYGENAGERLFSMEAALEITTYNPALLAENDVYFGALLQPSGRPQDSVGIQIEVLQPGIINIGQRTGETFTVISQRSVSGVSARLRLVRDDETSTLTVFFNDEAIGDPMPLPEGNDTLLPVLFVKDGGVIVSVTDWMLRFR